jgi:predicted outer membrane repeat protein
LETRNLPSTYVVDHLADDMVGDGPNGSLRYCITNATDGANIQFGVTGTINLSGALPNLTHSISIDGPGPDLLTVRRDTGGLYRIFAVAVGTTVSFVGMTIANGYCLYPDEGGGILNDGGTLTVQNCALSGNRAYLGGGIYNSGMLTLSNSIFSSNLADLGGAINNGGMLTVGDSTFISNSAGSGGGGICSGGAMTLTNSTVSENSEDLSSDYGYGGGIFDFFYGTMTVTNCSITDNRAGADGGGILSYGALTVNNSTLFGNLAADGGGIDGGNGTLTLSNSTLSSNSANTGGGVLEYGTCNITDCTIINNVADVAGGISKWFGTMFIMNSTIAGNAATYTGGVDNLYGVLTISNSTIAGNSSTGANSYGGGITNGDRDSGPATLTISNSTIADNFSMGQGGGAFNYPGKIFNARNTIIADNMAPTGADIFGSVTTSRYNLVGNTNGGSGFDPTDLLNVDPLLGPLQDNGGPTLTMALLDGSPAIDAGDNTDAPDWDQRGPGYPRIVNGIIDIGAFEVQSDRPGTNQDGL